MPQFTMHRNFTLRTTKGHTIVFVKDKPVWVPPMCLQDALAVGAKPVDDLPFEVLPEETGPPPDLSPEQRQEKMHAAFNDILTRNVRTEFTASGMPHIRRINELVGFDVSNAERDVAWKAYMEARADKEEQKAT